MSNVVVCDVERLLANYVIASAALSSVVVSRDPYMLLNSIAQTSPPLTSTLTCAVFPAQLLGCCVWVVVFWGSGCDM